MRFDVVLDDADILTLDARRPRAGALAIIGEQIVAVGDVGEFAAFESATAGVLHVSYMGDYIAEPFFDTQMRIVAVAYPALDAVLIGLAVWLLVIAGRQAVSLSLAAAALGALVIGNAVYNVQSIDGSFASGGLADVGWIAFVALLATAGLHPVVSLSAATANAATSHDVEHAVQSEPHDGNAPVARDVTPSDDVFAEIDRLILRDKQRDSVQRAEHVTRA